MSDACPMCGRLPLESHAVVEFAGLSINLGAFGVTFQGVPIKMPRSQFRVLAALVKNHGAPVSEDMIMEELYWNKYSAKEDPHPSVIKVFICHLRKRLAPTGIDILTVRCRGYELVIPKT